MSTNYMPRSETYALIQAAVEHEDLDSWLWTVIHIRDLAETTADEPTFVLPSEPYSLWFKAQTEVLLHDLTYLSDDYDEWRLTTDAIRALPTAVVLDA